MRMDILSQVVRIRRVGIERQHVDPAEKEILHVNPQMCNSSTGILIQICSVLLLLNLVKLFMTAMIHGYLTC